MRVEAAMGATAPVTQEKNATSTLGSDDFLKLLLAQLKNQDPLKPVDSTTQIAQLAQLSSLDEAVKQSDRLDALLQSSAVEQALSVIGREVATSEGIAGRAVSATVKDGRVVVKLDGGQEVTLGDGVRVGA